MTGVSGCLIVNKNRIVVLRITCSIVKLVQGRWIVARSIVFLLLIFFIRYLGGEGRRKRRYEKSHAAAHLQNRRWGVRCILNFVYQHYAPIMEWRQFVQIFFIAPPPPSKKGGKTVPLLLMSRFCSHIMCISREL